MTNVKSPIAMGARDQAMSYIRKGILGAIAITLICGASQFAAGEDLTVGMRSAQAPEQGVNRLKNLAHVRAHVVLPASRERYWI